MRRTPALRSLLVAVLVTAACGSDDGGASSAPSGGLQAGGLDPITTVEAPDGSVLDRELTGWDGQPTTVGAFGDGPIVLNFWASWCVPCVTEMPDFETVHQDLGDEITFLGVDVIDRQEDGQRLVDQTGITYAVARDPSGSLLRAMGGTQMPTTVFIAVDGTVAKVHRGALDESELRNLIHKTLR